MSSYTQGEVVEWQWGSRSASGTIEEVHTERVTRTIKGTEITRNGTAEEPAYTIVQADGDRVLKSHSEITKTN